MPSLNALHRELDARGLTLLLIDLHEDKETVRQAVRERQYTAPVLLDEGRASQAYGVRATPTVFVIGRDGAVLGRAIGNRPWAEAEGRALLQALLVPLTP